MSAEGEENHYATAANFGGDVQENERQPFVKKVTVPESIKRRVPSKHYVYKVVIEWSNNNTVIIYRRYTHFFDFLIKLQQLVSSLVQKKVIDGPVNLPELPGRVLFGRREVHQVAEKRRRKIEEFCQQLIQLPPEISESNLVLGFFNTWPDDTLLRANPSSQPVISNPVLTSPPPKHIELTPSPPNPTSPPVPTESPPPRPQSYTGTPMTPSTVLSSSHFSSSVLPLRSQVEQAIDAVITHPDEMENLEQYRVIADYDRKDSHQVSLHAGQIVHVIEKHDTGWWMVMSDDEQGYAPAVYLEPVEENSANNDVHPEDSIDEVYEAMESFAAENEDEVGFDAGERIHVVSKSMDGWWKIRSNGKVGYSPAALIRRKMSSSSHITQSARNFESEKFIYEEMNIHRPPPRRNTIDRTLLNKTKPSTNRVPPGYDSPRSNPALASHFDSDVYVDPAEEIYALPPEDDEEEIYTIPPELSDDEDQTNHYKVPRPLNGGNTAYLGSVHKAGVIASAQEGSVGTDRLSAPRRSIDAGKPGAVKTNALSTTANSSTASTSSKSDERAAPAMAGSQGGTKPKPSIYDDTVFENDDSKPTVATDSNPAIDDDDAVYENTEFDQETIARASLLKRPPIAKVIQSPTRHKPKKHTPDDYEDLEHFEGKSPTDLIPALDDYVDMDGCEHNTYVASEEFQRRGSDFSDTSVATPRTPLSAGPTPSTPLGVKSPPPLVNSTSKPTLLKSMSMDISQQPVMEDEYIEMEPACANLPETMEPTASPTAHVSSSEVSSRPKSKPARPSPPPRNDRKRRPNKSQSSQNVLNKILKKSPLIRAKSMEDILSSVKGDYAEIPRRHSPPLEEETFKPTPPPLPPPRIPGSVSKTQNCVESTDGPKSAQATKPKTSYFKSAKNQKPVANGHLPSSSRRSASPPSSDSPVSPSDSTVSPQKLNKRQSSPDIHMKREQLLSQMIEKMQTKFIALHSYSNTKEGCLSFSAGELCTVKQKKSDGWWLVRIGDREGWTPGNYWKEESSVSAPLVQKASEVIRKPRSRTVATDNLNSTSEATSTTSEDSLRTASLSLSAEEKSSFSSSMDKSRPLLPTRPPPFTKTKGKGPPPPRPRPFGAPPQGSNTKKPKPVPPQKPSAVKLAARVSPVPSPPQERRKKKSVSPPPLPPPNPTRKFGSPYETTSTEAKVDDDEYVMLKDATTTVNDIKSAPWFSGKMDRMQAEQFLMEYGRQREFLVRERTAKDGFYALSIRYHYSCKHFNIDPTSDGQYSMGTLTFPNIDEIIRHYQQNSLFIHDGHHVTLGQPAKRKARASDASKYNPHC